MILPHTNYLKKKILLSLVSICRVTAVCVKNKNHNDNGTLWRRKGVLYSKLYSPKNMDKAKRTNWETVKKKVYRMIEDFHSLADCTTLMGYY